MTDEQQRPEPQPIHFTQSTVRVVTDWPEVTSFAPEWLEKYAHTSGATVNGDTVTFEVFNGGAVYHLTGEVDGKGHKIAVLQDSKKTSRRP